MSLDNLYIAVSEPYSPILIADKDDNDVCQIYSSDESTSDFPREDAERLARLIVAAPDLAAIAEQLLGIITTDNDFARGYIQQIEQAQRVLSKAYGVS